MSSKLFRAAFPNGEDRMLTKEQYLNYLEDCANRWETLGSIEQANVIRCRILTVLNSPEETPEPTPYRKTKIKLQSLLAQVQVLLFVASQEECPWPLLHDCLFHAGRLWEQADEVKAQVPFEVCGFVNGEHPIIPLNRLQAAFQKPIPWDQLRKEQA